jgi:hypothetical protein
MSFATATFGFLLSSGWAATAESQEVKRFQATLVDAAGIPVPNQAVVIEGVAVNYTFFGLLTKKEAVQVIAVTDSSGLLQIVDLPAGSYEMKAVVPSTDSIANTIKVRLKEHAWGATTFRADTSPGTAAFQLEQGYKEKAFTGIVNVGPKM